MHSIFFGLRQYCSACHQWHFSPRNMLCVFQVSTEKTISARSQKRMKRNRQKSFSFFLLRGGWRLWKPSCVLFLSWFPYAWPPEGGQAARANFLTGRGTDGDKDTNPSTNQMLSFPTATPLTILWHHQDSHTERQLNRHRRNRKQQNHFPSTALLFFSSSSASKPATLCCALGLINMNQTVNDQREWEISKG